MISHLSDEQKKEISGLIQDFPSLFGNVPSQTSVLQHDVQVTVKLLKEQAYEDRS